MKFIRKNGRVIPISDEKARSNHLRKSTKANVVAGAAMGTYLVGARETAIHAVRSGARSKAFKGYLGLTLASGVATLAASGVSVYHRRQAHKIRRISFVEGIKQNLKETGAIIAGAGAVIGAYAGLLHGGGALAKAIKDRRSIKAAEQTRRTGLKFGGLLTKKPRV